MNTAIRTHTKSSAFTIVELLIVIVVIAILAAITVVAYNGIQNRTYDTSVQADLSNMVKILGVEAIKNSDVHLSTPTTSMGIKVSKNAYKTDQNNFYYCLNTTTNQYAIAARSKSGKQYKVVNGTISEHSVQLYGVDTCSLVIPGATTWTGALGYDVSTPPNWAGWVN